MIPKKPKPPCKDCLDREVGCHSRCEHYQEYRKRMVEIYEYRRNEAEAKHDIMTHIVEVRKKMNMTERKPKGFIQHRTGMRMMDKLAADVHKLIDEELERANALHGAFRSIEEARGVLDEEADEAEESFGVYNDGRIHDVCKRLHRYFRDLENDWYYDISCKELESLVSTCDDIACEVIQVGAMAKKTLNFIKEARKREHS